MTRWSGHPSCSHRSIAANRGPKPNSSRGAGRNGTGGSAASRGLTVVCRWDGHAAGSGRAVLELTLISQPCPVVPGKFCMVPPGEGSADGSTQGFNNITERAFTMT